MLKVLESVDKSEKYVILRASSSNLEYYTGKGFSEKASDALTFDDQSEAMGTLSSLLDSFDDLITAKMIIKFDIEVQVGE